MINKDFVRELTTQQKSDLAQVMENPAVWAESLFPAKTGARKYRDSDGVERTRKVLKSGWLTRPWQLEVLSDRSLKKVVRVSRRAGKSALSLVKCLHKSFVEGRGVIVVAPMEAQVIELYRNIHKSFMDTRPDIFNEQTVTRDTKSPYFVEFANGGFIRFITAGTKAGGKGDAVRGQGNDLGLLYIDEMDYLTDDDIQAIFALIAQDDSIEVICTSTPTGKRGIFYKLCVNTPAGWAAFHKTCWEAIPGWNEARDLEMRAILSEVGYQHEMLAEFGAETEGVFHKETIDQAMERGNDPSEYPYPHPRLSPRDAIKHPHYGYAQSLPANPLVYRIVGVDWDKYQAGSQILVIEASLRMPEADDHGKVIDPTSSSRFQFIKVVHRREIPIGEFTLSRAVEALVSINREFSPNFYYLDAGYGEHQIETLIRMGMACKDPDDPAYGIHKKIKRINFSQGVDVVDPHTGEMAKKPIKPEMVGRLRNKFDAGEIVMSPYDTIISTQLMNYRVEKITSYGTPRYTSVNEHAVDALMLAVWGLYCEYGDQKEQKKSIGLLDGPIGERYLQMMQEANVRPLRYQSSDVTDGVDEDNYQEDMALANRGLYRRDGALGRKARPTGDFFQRGSNRAPHGRSRF